MESLVDFALQERYKQVKDLGDRLGELATLIEWEPFRREYRNGSKKLKNDNFFLNEILIYSFKGSVEFLSNRSG